MAKSKIKSAMEKNALAMKIGLNIIIWVIAIFFVYLLFALFI